MSGERAPRLRVLETEAFERPLPLRLPFRFGRVTLRQVRQAFLRARVELEGGASAWGWAAELMIPKWFDKDPTRSDADNVADLRDSLAAARSACAEDAEADGAWRLSRAWRERLAARPAPRGGLVAGYGPALLERAVLDGLCRALGAALPQALRVNAPGIDFREALGADFDSDAFLAGLEPAASITARHTVGLADPIGAADRPADAPDDGLPVTLEEVIARYGQRCFKIKLGGERDADLARLRALARVLDPLPGLAVTLDGNEQFADVAAAADFLEALAADPALARLRRALLYLEQPIHRDKALAEDVAPLARFAPVVADESDAHDDAFVEARARGYAGISSKTCKGFYRSLLNRARCALWSAEGGDDFFMAAEDLTTQPGLAVQQDLLLASLVGCEHVERNGHHYAAGMLGASERERDAFAAAHPDLYRRDGDALRLRIEEGRISLASLDCVGYASGALPDPEALAPMETP